MNSTIIKFYIILLLSSLFFSNHIFAQSSNIEINISPNQKSDVGYIYNTSKDFFGNCINYPISIYVSQNPKFGTIELVEESMTLEDDIRTIEANGITSEVTYREECAGKVVPIIRLYYTPKPGFSGIDIIKTKSKTSEAEFVRIIYVE